MSETTFKPLLGYGSQTGNAEILAANLRAAAHAAGVDLAPTRLNEVRVDSLAEFTHAVVITSTYGDGEVPDNAALFWDELETRADAPVAHLRYAVLALGDADYDDFANGGRLIDERLAELGATRLAERTEVDDDFEDDAAAWIARTVDLLTAEAGAGGGDVDLPVESTETPADAAVVSQEWDRSNPYPAAVVVNRLLSGPGSDKEVRHYELDITGSGIEYAPGDALAVHVANDPELVQCLLDALAADADAAVEGHDLPLGRLLAERLEIRTPSRALLETVAARLPGSEVAQVLGSSGPARDAWLWGRDVVDLVALAGLGADDVVPTLKALAPRDYSIASSQRVTPDRVALTVSTVRHERDGRKRGGVASTFLADRADVATVGIHVQPNHDFRLPADDVPIVMIGPGTGIAPFLSFLAERRARAATGRSWLFHGDRRREHDHGYRDEIEAFVADGSLSRLDLVFSRDQAEKVYVQHRMAEHADDLFAWLEEGAHLYVCGDESRMARDVDAELHRIVADRVGGEPAAREWIHDLVRQRRYVRDVY